MPRTIKTFRRVSAGLQRRFRTARPGSVLILVVALLVLMALIGTAWLSSARIDRYDTRQSASSAQIDLLVDGVVNMTKAAELNDITSNGFARPEGYGGYDLAQADGFIAGRAPAVMRDIAPIWTEFERATPVDPAYVPASMTADTPRKRKYYEGQFVRVPIGAIAGGVFEYYVCTHTHIVDTVANPDVPSYPGPPAAATHPYWRLVGEDTPGVLQGVTDPMLMTRQVYAYTPVWPTVTRLGANDKFHDITGVNAAFSTRSFVIPTFMDFAGDPKFPAFRLYSENAFPANTSPGTRGGLIVVPAADTDGDGVADACLFKLPVGTLEGLDYYAAVRVVDNGAAINFNTALSQRGDIMMATGTFPPPADVSDVGMTGMFKSHIGLFEWLNPSIAADNPRWLELTQFNFLRMGGVTPVATTAHPMATAVFRTWGEAMETDLSRNLATPVGQYTPFSNGLAGSFYFRAGLLRNPDAIQSQLERNLGNVKVPTNAAELQDSAFYDAVWERMPNALLFGQPDTQKWKTYKEAPLTAGPRRDGSGGIRHPYDPNYAPVFTAWPSFIHRWFDENFNQWGYTDNVADANVIVPPDQVAATALTTRPRLLMGADAHELVTPAPPKSVRRGIRPFIVNRNPVGNQGSIRTAAVTGVSPAMAPTPPNTVSQPRASVNTAPFNELFRAFWSVMAEEWMPAGTVPASHTPFSQRYRFLRGYADPTGREAREPTPIVNPLYGSWHNNPYIGTHFVSDSIDVAGNTLATSHNPDTTTYLPAAHPLHMFRSVVRPNIATDAAPFNNSTPRMQPDQVLQLRAALAAANAMDMRDDDDVVTFQDITIPATNDVTIGLVGDASPELIVRVFGTERQPFVTETYVNTNVVARTPSMSYPGVDGLDNPQGYVAIELHNPYPVPIDIRNCRIATINRQDTTAGVGGTPRNVGAGPPAPTPVDYTHNWGTTKLLVVDRSSLTDDTQRISLDPTATWGGNSASEVMIHSNVEQSSPGVDFHSPTVIPPFGYLVLENYDARTAPGSPVSPPTDARVANYRPPALLVPGPTGIPGDEPGGVDNADPIPEKNLRRNFAYVKNLDRLINQEFVLLRPFGTTGEAVTIAGTAQTALSYTIQGGSDDIAAEMAPLDSYDFTGIIHPSDPNDLGRAHAWHYVRASDAASAKSWHFVYPGRYDGMKSRPDPLDPANPDAQRPRQQGTDEARELVDPTLADPVAGPALGWDPSTAVDPWEVRPSTVPIPAPGGEAPVPGFSMGWHSAELPPNAADASYPIEFTIQIQSQGWPSNRPSTYYPHGGFARNGDILQVPYIGAYTIKLATQNTAALDAHVLEMNALPMDATFAEDTDRSNDPPIGGVDVAGVRREQIGRFVPLPAADLAVAARGVLDTPTGGGPMTPFGAAHMVADLERTEAVAGYWAGSESSAGPGSPAPWYDLVITSGALKGRTRTIAAFDESERYLYTSTPWADTVADLPAAGTSYEIRRGTYRWATDLFDYLTVISPHQDAVPNIPGGVAIAGTGPIDGLININTASWRVLAAIPWTTVDNDGIIYNDGNQVLGATPMSVISPGHLLPGANGVPDNYDIARAIVAYRDSEIAAGADPLRVFQSIYDVYQVPGFQKFADDTQLVGTEPDDENGDLSPFGPGTDGVRSDFEEQFALINRVSNLISTRSDSYTNYILVQGWRGIGQPGVTPELVVQRQRAFTTDRSGVTTDEKSILTEFFYNE